MASEMKNIKIKLKLPEEIIVNIPTLSNIELENVLELINIEGKNLIYRKVQELAIEKFLEKHQKLIKETAKKVLEKIENELENELENDIEEALKRYLKNKY